ncbi:MAG: TSUP family transporter, partial [Rhodospirillaceae bacterium]
MKDPMEGQADNAILFCTRPWRVMGIAVTALVGITLIWGMIILTTYRSDDRFGNDHTLSVTEFMSRNVALPGSVSLPDVVAPAVVAIDGGKINGGIVASGAIVGANGYVLTTLHAIEGLPEITIQVRTKAGLRSFAAQLVKKAPTHDLALLKIQSPGSFLYLSLADTSAGLGGSVYAFGLDGRGDLVVRQGSVAARPVPLAVEGLQISHLRPTDAVYSWEQNGGPVVNGDGAVVGLTIAVRDADGTVRGYVVPADVIVSHFRDVLEFKMLAPSPAAAALPPQAAVPGPGAPRMVEAALPAGAPPALLGAGPLTGGPALNGAANWWVRAANQVGAAAQPMGLAGAPANGPPLAQPMAQPGDVEHLLGLRIAGFSLEDLLGLTALALVKGVIGGMMTMGGGVFLVAGMMMFFGYGLFLIRPVAYLTNIFVYSASAMRHHRNGLIMWDEVKSLAPWAVVGVVAGYFIGNAISDRIIEILLGLFAVMISVKAAHEVLGTRGDDILLAKNGDAGRADSDDDDEAAAATPPGDTFDDDSAPARPASSLEALAKPALLALPMGVISGILGITGGVIEVPLQHYVGKIPLKNAIANSAVLVFCASLTGTILAFVHGTATGIIDWRTPLTLAAILIPASFAGGIIGAHLTKLAPKPALKTIFSILMM